MGSFSPPFFERMIQVASTPVYYALRRLAREFTFYSEFPAFTLANTDRPGLIGHDRRLGIGIAEAGGTGSVWVGCDRRLGAAVHGSSISIDRLAGGGAARIRPDQVGAAGACYNAGVIPQELLLQVVVARAVWIRRGATDQ